MRRHPSNVAASIITIVRLSIRTTNEQAHSKSKSSSSFCLPALALPSHNCIIQPEARQKQEQQQAASPIAKHNTTTYIIHSFQKPAVRPLTPPLRSTLSHTHNTLPPPPLKRPQAPPPPASGPTSSISTLSLSLLTEPCRRRLASALCLSSSKLLLPHCSLLAAHRRRDLTADPLCLARRHHRELIPPPLHCPPSRPPCYCTTLHPSHPPTPPPLSLCHVATK